MIYTELQCVLKQREILYLKLCKNWYVNNDIPGTFYVIWAKQIINNSIYWTDLQGEQRSGKTYTVHHKVKALLTVRKVLPPVLPYPSLMFVYQCFFRSYLVPFSSLSIESPDPFFLFHLKEIICNYLRTLSTFWYIFQYFHC